MTACGGGAGHCASCATPIGDDDAIVAAGHLYHVNHWRCDVCDSVIDVNEQCYALNEYVRVACERCCARLSPKCALCRRPLTFDRAYVMVDGTTLHRECFRCARCQRTLQDTYHLDRDHRALDHDCWWGQALVDHIVADPENLVKDTT